MAALVADPRWRATADERAALAVLEAAAQALRLLGQAGPRPSDPFSPDAIRYWHGRDGWAALTGAECGGAVRYDSAHGGPSDPLGLAEIKAQLEQALDLVAADRLHWRSVSWLYRRQGRWKVYRDKRAIFGRPPPDAPAEPPPPWGLVTLYDRMADACGWLSVAETSA